MQNPPGDRYTPPTSGNKYSPSVPISVYRELAAELQTAQTTIHSLKAENQQLVKQNQQLRKEIEKVVQSAQQLQHMVASLGSVSGVEIPQPTSVRQPEPRPVAPAPPPRSPASTAGVEFPPPPQASEPEPPPYTETLIIEEDTRSRHTPPSEGSSAVSGWLLVVAIFLIVLTASFGAGFLLLRSKINNNNR